MIASTPNNSTENYVGLYKKQSARNGKFSFFKYSVKTLGPIATNKLSLSFQYWLFSVMATSISSTPWECPMYVNFCTPVSLSTSLIAAFLSKIPSSWYENYQNSGSYYERVMWLVEYLFPLLLPSQTS